VLLQPQQGLNPHFHLAEVLIYERVDFSALLSGCIPQLQQSAHFPQRHVERTAVPDELQPFDVPVTVQPKVTFTTRRLRHQTFLLIVTDGHYLASGLFGEFTNLDTHSRALTISLDSIVTIDVQMLKEK
jgi:hypothetical protein